MTTTRKNFVKSSGGYSDELSLVDIWNILLVHRKLIIIITAIFFLGSLVAALLLPPLYKSEVVLLPPVAGNVEKLNIPDFFTIKPDDLYGRFLRNLQSVNQQEKFFRARKLLDKLQLKKNLGKSEHDVFLDVFSDRLMLKRLTTVTKDNNVFSFSLEGDNPERIAGWLNDYVVYTNDYTVQSVVKDIEAKVGARTAMLEKKIKSLREVAKLRRSDRIAMLEEAAGIASKLKIDEQVGSVYIYSQRVKGKHEELTSIKETPSYLRGSRALHAEKEVLKNRKNDDPFIPALRPIQEELLFYRSIIPESDGVQAARIDQAAIAENEPVKPKTKLIVFLGSLSGVIIGLVIVLFIGILERPGAGSYSA